MARKTIAELTALFQDGDTPGGADFASIFDSNLNLQETGTSVVSGSITLLGGQTTSGSLNISGSILPDGSGSHDLGSEAHPWGEIYVISSSINFMSNDGRKLATISVDADGNLETIPSGSTTPDPIVSFPFTGDAVITGSLLISGSSQYFRVDADDVVIGYGAGANLDSGTDSYNVLIGYEAGHTLDNDNYTVLIGYQAGKLLDHSGGINYSTYVGYQAGTNVTTGNKNVAVGYLALKDDATTGGENIVVGHQAAQQGLGNNNVVLGGDAIRLTGAGTPDDNVVIGHQAGGSLSGNKNVFIGKQAGNTTTTGENNVLIGYDVEGSAVGASNELRIGYGTVHALSASLSTGDVLFPSTASSAYFSGDGSNLTNLQRPITTVSANPFTASVANAGEYFRAGGNITCSILANSTASCPIGSEFELIQTSSAGNLLFETGSGVTFNSKDGNLNLAGQFSAATLKKVGTDEWDLVGDLS